MQKNRILILILTAAAAALLLTLTAVFFASPRTVSVSTTLYGSEELPLTISLTKVGKAWTGKVQIGEFQRGDIADVTVRKLAVGYEYTLICRQIVAVGDGYKLTELPAYTIRLDASPHFYAAFGHYAGTYEISADDFEELKRCK